MNDAAININIRLSSQQLYFISFGFITSRGVVYYIIGVFLIFGRNFILFSIWVCQLLSTKSGKGSLPFSMSLPTLVTFVFWKTVFLAGVRWCLIDARVLKFFCNNNDESQVTKVILSNGAKQKT